MLVMDKPSSWAAVSYRPGAIQSSAYHQQIHICNLSYNLVVYHPNHPLLCCAHSCLAGYPGSLLTLVKVWTLHSQSLACLLTGNCVSFCVTGCQTIMILIYDDLRNKEVGCLKHIIIIFIRVNPRILVHEATANSSETPVPLLGLW